MKVEAASNDITEYPRDDKPSIGTLCFFYTSAIIRQCLRHCFHIFIFLFKIMVSRPHPWSWQNDMVHQDQVCDRETVLHRSIHLHNTGLWSCYAALLLRATAYAVSAYMLSQFRLSVCLSVCPSHGWISQKRLKLGSCNFHHTVAHPSRFCALSFIRKFWRVPPERGRQTRVG